MNVYVDTLALLHIIWQDIKDQLAVVASRVRQPQKSTLMIVQQVSIGNARSDGAKLDSTNYVMYLYSAKFETSVHLYSLQSTTVNSYTIFSIFYMIL